MLSALFMVLFGFSLLPGRRPVCLRMAECSLHGVLPAGAEPYCRRLTWIWFWLLAGMTLVDVATLCRVDGFPTWEYGLFSALVHASVFAAAFAD